MIKKQLIFVSNVAWLQKLVAAMCWMGRKKDNDPRSDVTFAKIIMVKRLKELVRNHQEYLKKQEIPDDSEQVNIVISDITVADQVDDV